jgi:DNA (cytosine-5)-methyltransferase 1
MILDLFAGPGGWDHAATALLGLDDVTGIELDAHACATRAAAGLRTIQADVAEYAPRGSVSGLIASPPCQAFSRAGKRGGKDDAKALRAHLLASAKEWQEPAPPDEWADPRSPLVLQPLRYVHELQPEWVALEQVPPVLPLWSTYDVVLSGLGYRCWAGKVDAADYGVPQHRLRAVLLAHRERPMAEPRKTHGPGRTHAYVTMAEALGWERGTDYPRNDQTGTPVDLDWPWQRPAPTIAGRLLAPDPGSNANRFNGSTKSRNDGYRITEREAGLLQSFPGDYPWSGRPSSRPEQIGNAVPPLLAQAILAQFT